MSSKTIPIGEWLLSLRQAADDLLHTSLRFEKDAAAEAAERSGGKRAPARGKAAAPKKSGPRAAATPASADEQHGAYIAVLGEANAMHLGLTTSPDGCRALARGLLGMRSTEELSEKDAVDGVSEVMNIIAGKVKSTMSDRDHSLRLGMPIFMQQPIQVREGLERVEADVMIGPVPCTLMVFRMKQAA
ncbi:MAG: chemotaxis protein CheX [Candidatus Eiseniibacteriota bacterium]